MNKEQINKEFDEFDAACNVCKTGFKQHLFETIEKVILDLVGEEEKLSKVEKNCFVLRTPSTVKVEKLAKNQKRQAILNKAKEVGLIK